MTTRAASIVCGVLGVCALSGLLATRVQGQAAEGDTWNPKAAAAYMDGRAAWWTTWSNAKRDHDTFCVSCHTALPYVLARSSLRSSLHEQESTATERQLFENVAKRVALWKDVAPFYSDQSVGLPKTSESRGTEAILNAVVLANRDASAKRLSDDTRTAFGNLWALQMKTGTLNGAWAWLNFKYEPWESNDGSYFGASIASLAIGTAPDGYASTAEIQEGLKRLRGYMQREHDRQPLHNRLMAVWASTRVSDLLTPEQRAATVDAALAAQQEDGGWSTASLGTFKRVDGSALDVASDGYATGLVTFVLQQAGASDNARVRKGLGWLRRHQDPSTGQWRASSLNKQRDPASDSGRFMSDAATAYAVLSLTLAR